MRVTVIIPTYNRAGLVCEAVESVLAQTLVPTQVLIVDDGSTDDTGQAIRQYGERITYVSQENRGVSAARNAGLERATGDYVAFLDSDDMWHPMKLALQVAVFERLSDVNLLFTEFEILKQDGTKLPLGSRRWLGDALDFSGFYERSLTTGELGLAVADVPVDVPIYLGHVYGTMLHEALGLTSTAVVRRTAATKGLRFTEGVSLHEDREFFARVARTGVVGFVDFEAAINRGHEGRERLTRMAPGLARVQSYLGLLDRVWKADREFATHHAEELQRIEGRALLALAREGILASRPDIARRALERWRALQVRERAGDARVYGWCAAVPGGSSALRLGSKARTLLRVLSGKNRRGYSINPAA